ncbi:MAG: hypothetical protein H6810_05290 [Phycisphaeraceae bacterium]|nr:MAG: hypothetical protein H6810_05290 [Phycisphaeraceae bacterium]
MVRLMTITAALVTSSALAGPDYSINWYTIDGGGGTSAGGGYTLSGTIGQHDASNAMTGGAYTLTGGFWAGVGAGPCNAADIAEPYGILDLVDITTFVSGFLGTDPIADLNSDGLFDLTDINLFVTTFLAGCP